MGYSVLQRMIINSAEILIIVVNFIFQGKPDPGRQIKIWLRKSQTIHQ
jgi:hypothetical protein